MSLPHEAHDSECICDVNEGPQTRKQLVEHHCRRFVSNRFKLGELFGIMQRGITNLHWVRVCRRSCAVRYRERRAEDKRKRRERAREREREGQEMGSREEKRAPIEQLRRAGASCYYAVDTDEKRSRNGHE